MNGAAYNRWDRRSKQTHSGRYGMRVDRAAQRKARFIQRRLERQSADRNRNVLQ